MPVAVVLDTNALLLPFERRLRLEDELRRLLGSYEALVPEPCLRELHRIATHARGARADRARMAITFATRFVKVPATGAADNAALALARDRSGYLVTNDAALGKRARDVGVRIILLKGLSHLAFDEPDAE